MIKGLNFLAFNWNLPCHMGFRVQDIGIIADWGEWGGNFGVSLLLNISHIFESLRLL